MPDLHLLYSKHPDSELAAWAQRLHFFRFCAPRPKEDGESLQLVLRFDGLPDLLELFRSLAIVPAYVGRDTLPLPGQGWASAAAYQSVLQVQGMEPLINPGWTNVCGTPAHVYVSGIHCKVSLQNPVNIYEVTAGEVDRAAVLESKLAVESERFIDPPRDDQWCLCPRYYPWLWA